ncbi:MAG: hypothetical protein KC442_07255 [Thermomicrobiales bacterium]|nr:hypothetical protein [Thermomicrobiales bacterium]
MDAPMLVAPESATDHQPVSPGTRRIPRYTFRLMLTDETLPGSLSFVSGYVYHGAGRWWMNATAGRPAADDPNYPIWIDEEIAPLAAAELARLLACLGVVDQQAQ